MRATLPNQSYNLKEHISLALSVWRVQAPQECEVVPQPLAGALRAASSCTQVDDGTVIGLTRPAFIASRPGTGADFLSVDNLKTCNRIGDEDCNSFGRQCSANLLHIRAMMSRAPVEQDETWSPVAYTNNTVHNRGWCFHLGLHPCTARAAQETVRIPSPYVSLEE